MQCYNCKHDFCWMCLGDWKSHGSEYYECSRYKENPNIAHESVHAQAREALKKYLHYYERVCWFSFCNVLFAVKVMPV
jgi:ariadne-2